MGQGTDVSGECHVGTMAGRVAMPGRWPGVYVSRRSHPQDGVKTEEHGGGVCRQVSPNYVGTDVSPQF